MKAGSGPASWIAADGGTSNLRAWAMDAQGAVLAEAAAAEGMGGLSRHGFEPARLRLVSSWRGDGAIPVLACGMAGARPGWTKAPCRAVPRAPLDAGGMTEAPVRDRRRTVHIVSGLSQDRPADVRRGEETRIAGVPAAGPDFDGVPCLPETRSRWARARLSGLPIGAEPAAARPCRLGQRVALVGNDALSAACARALALQAVPAKALDATDGTLAGLASLRRLQEART